jgi:non-heme chloroperoxidase
MISGGGRVRLHVVETGNSRGPTLVFLHGISQSWLTWTRQLNSELAESHRLIAVDLRGHGRSDKPREGYADSRLWAADLQAVIEQLALDRPILCGWSYGPLVILDYLRHCGEDEIGGITFVGGVTKLGSEEAAAVMTPEFLSLVPGFFSVDAEESMHSLGSLLRLCFATELSDEDYYRMLGYSLSVPPHVRQELFSRSLDNDDLLPKLRKPVLIVHGAHDAVVSPAVIDQQMARIGSARTRVMPTGHGCFWDDAAGYNRCLSEFCQQVSSRSM